MDGTTDIASVNRAQELGDPLNSTYAVFEQSTECKKAQGTSRRDSILFRFCKRKVRPAKDRSSAYRPIVENINEDAETDHVATKRSVKVKEAPESESQQRRKGKRNKFQEKSATFDYADLKNEAEFQSRINIRRTAICAKSKSTDAIQLETFLVVSRLKQFDLI